MPKVPENTSRTHALILSQSQQHGVPAGTLVEKGSIEAMEAEGQRQLVASESLPVVVQEQHSAAEALLWKWGFKLGPPYETDEIFRPAELPPGWTRRATDHAMWSELLDAQGRRRVEVFYKAAFYDRKAFMRLLPRYDAVAFTDDVDLLVQAVVPDKLHRLCSDAPVVAYVVTDRQRCETLGVYTGSSYSATRDAAYKHIEELEGGAWGPELWTD